MSLSSDDVKRKVRVEISSKHIDGRYLNATDSTFLEIALEDVQNFQEKGILSSVLVFPPFNNYHRFLIHKLVEDYFEDLSTFSVGHSSGRRTVVCYKEQLQRQEILSKATCVATTNAMGVHHHSNSKEEQDSQIINNSGRKKVRALPDVAIYRPPALRKSDEGQSASTCERKQKLSKQRRPDIAVYVPRALRGAPNPTGTPKSSSTASGLVLNDLSVSSNESEKNDETESLSSSTRKANVSKKMDSCSIQLADQKLSGIENNLHMTRQCISLKNCISSTSNRSSSPTASISQPKIPRKALSPSSLLPDPVPHDKVIENSIGSDSCSSLPSTIGSPFCDELSPIDHVVQNECSSCTVLSKENGKHREPAVVANTHDVTSAMKEKSLTPAIAGKTPTDVEYTHFEETTCGIISKKPSLDTNHISVGLDDKALKEKCLEEPVHCKSKIVGATCLIPKKHEKVSEENNSVNVNEMSGGIEIQSNEINSLNKTIISDPIIPETDGISTKNLHESQHKGIAGSENDSDENSVPLLSWEELFDLSEDGLEVTKAGGSNKVLHAHKLYEEVVTAVGKVSVVEKPQSDYTQYRTDGAHMLAELSHVVEVYGFPSEFKTQDLISVLSSYGGGNSGAPAFEIKWVDDTHALAVFASSFVAADVLNLRHPMVKTRALEEACAASKTKARKTCDSLRIPFRPRPETCPALAQRLITGALGVHHRQSKAERDEERRLLREAREKRRNAAKERDAAWEGTIGSLL